MPKPTIGRIVHYVSYGTQYLVAEPMDGCPNGTDGDWIASLAVLNPTGIFLNENVPMDEAEHAGGTWHWPEREDG